MQRTLYLHVGAHRTATSSIQKFLQQNFEALQEQGYLQAFGQARHFDIVNRIFKRELDVAELSADLAQRADAKAHPIHSIILSDEDICTRSNLARLARFRAFFDVKLVFMLRRQDLWIESWYQQNVKWQWNAELANLTFAEFLAKRGRFFWIDYDARVRHMEKLFGTENVICRVFERSAMPEGPVATFCDAIGLTDRSGLLPPPHINTSLSPQMTEFMRHLPLNSIPEKQRRAFEQACVKADWHVRRQSGPQSPHYMDPATRALVLAEYADANATLARRHFGRDQLFLEPLPPADAPLAPQQLPDDSALLMEAFVRPFVSALAEIQAAQAEAARKAAEAKQDRI